MQNPVPVSDRAYKLRICISKLQNLYPFLDHQDLHGQQQLCLIWMLVLREGSAHTKAHPVDCVLITTMSYTKQNNAWEKLVTCLSSMVKVTVP